LISHIGGQLNHNIQIGTIPEVIEDTNRVKKKRIAEKDSFELVNNNVNLEAVHNILLGNFIDSRTDLEVFKRVFSGKRIVKKVVWDETSSLRYFIRSVCGSGVISPNEGKWVRTVNCFKKHDRGYSPGEFKGAHDPVESVKISLNRAISLINNSRTE
jgi:hypothetical protein